MKKVTVILMLLLLLSLVSCGGDRIVEIDEEAFLTEAKAILSAADELNTVLFEPAGIPVIEDGFSTGKYKAVYLNRCEGFNRISLKAIHEKIDSIYSEAMAQTVEMLVFNPDIVDGEPIRYARYIEFQSGDKDHPQNGTLMAYTGMTEFWSDEIDIDTESISFVSAVKEAKSGDTVVTVTVNVTVTAKNGATQTRNLDFRFIEVDGGYRLDDLVTLVYDEALKN